MDEVMIEVEADTLEEATQQLKSRIPAGLDILSYQVISDGKPVVKAKQAIEVEAESLEEARERVKAQTPAGLQLLAEKILSDGKPRTEKASADTTDKAFTIAQGKIPSHAAILEKKELAPPERKVITVEAFDELTADSKAESEAKRQFGVDAAVKSVRLAIAGSKGLLGMGKKPAQYEAEVLVRPATVEVSYKLKARISAEVGEVRQEKARISATAGSLATKLHQVVVAMCASPGRSFSMEAHAAPLNSVLARSQIPKDVAELFVEVTTLTATFRGVRTTESMDALTKLCAIQGPVVDNLLHCIADMSDVGHKVNVVDMSGRATSGASTTEVSFEPQRNMAREELAKRGSPKYDAKYYVEASSQPSSAAPPASPGRTTESSILRLADPAHPARKQLDDAVKIVDQYVQVVLAGERTAMHVSAPAGEMGKALASLDEAIALCPDDMDLLVAKASTLHASAQFKSAEEVLDAVLSKAPDHFEAKMWKSHWETWSDALRFPAWDERRSSLHLVMAAHLRQDHRVQVVRDGMQKALAIVTGVQGPPFDARTQVKVEWVLSRTPYGPLVAYYPKIIEPSGEPSTMEAFLPIFQPTLFSPMEGYFLVQQLAFTPYCSVVLVSGNAVLLNRRTVLGQETTQRVREMAAQLAVAQTYLRQDQFQSAMQWHMGNFDMARLTYE